MDAVIRTEALHKHFGALHAVDGLDLSIPAGQIYGLLGPNGSGKTTLIRLLLGLLRPTSGRVMILGIEMPHKPVLGQIGYMTQAAALYDELTARENVAFFAAMYGTSEPIGRARIDEVLDLVDLSDRAGSQAHTFSGGMKQRLSLACAIVHRPRLLLLDEPTVGVDPQLRVAFWDYFRRLAADNVTIVVSSHVMDEAERCDRLGFMRQGRLLAEGSAAELRAQVQADTLEEAFLRFTGR